MSTITTPELKAAAEETKNQIIQRLVTKYDVQSACDSARDKILGTLQSMQLENQAMLRQMNAERDQSWRKITTLEKRIYDLTYEVKTMRRQLMGEISDDTPHFSSELSVFPVK